MTVLEFERPYLYPKQFDAMYDPRRLSAIEASTKAGKTISAIVWLFEQALAGAPGRNYWWVAPVSPQADIAFRRMVRAVPRDLCTAHLGIKTVTLVNGNVIWFKSADRPDSLYGEDVFAAVIDEASRVKEDAWFAVRSTLTATRGPVRIVGNVKGRRNWFYNIARRAEQGADPEYGYHKITADDAVQAGVLDREEIEQARRDLPEQVFEELYYAKASDDGGNPFGLQHIKACVKPLSTLPAVNWGWDLAKKQDWAVGIGLDRNGVCARFERFHHVAWGEVINRIISHTGNAPALVDSTGVGDPILDLLQAQGGQNFQGYIFSPPSKQKLMEGLALAIQTRTVGYPDGLIVDELEQFEFVATRTGVTYSAPEGYFDDCVCALALASMSRTIIPAPLEISPAMIRRAQMLPRRRHH